MIIGVNLGYHSIKLYPLINDQYTVRPDEAFRFAVGSFIENVWFVLVYRQTKANILTLMLHETILITGTCFIQKIYAPSSSLLQGKHLPFTPSPLRLNIFRLFVILSLTQLYRYTPEIFLFSTATFKYKYPPPPPWSKEEEGAYIFWMKQMPVILII